MKGSISDILFAIAYSKRTRIVPVEKSHFFSYYFSISSICMWLRCCNSMLIRCRYSIRFKYLICTWSILNILWTLLWLISTDYCNGTVCYPLYIEKSEAEQQRATVESDSSNVRWQFSITCSEIRILVKYLFLSSDIIRRFCKT